MQAVRVFPGAKIQIEFPEKKKDLKAAKGGKIFSNKNVAWGSLGRDHKEGLENSALGGGGAYSQTPYLNTCVHRVVPFYIVLRLHAFSSHGVHVTFPTN